MKRFLFLFAILANLVKGQILFTERFNSLTLTSNSYTVANGSGAQTVTTTYTTVPSSFSVINDNYKNSAGSLSAPNKPFNISLLQYQGWAVSYNPAVDDTFLVSTSWLDSTTTTPVKRFVVTPVISGINANTILSWEAMSPDPNYREGYQVLVTTNTTGTLSATDFSLAPIFSLQDGNNSGGGEKTTWTKRGVSLGSYAGQNVRVAFKDVSQNMYQLWLDDIQAETVPFNLDAEVSAGKPNAKYVKPLTNNFLNCRVTNKGAATVNSFTLNYSVAGGTPQSQAFNLNLYPYSYIDLPMNTPYSLATPGYYKIKMWVSMINGTTDPNHTNDTLFTAVTVVSSVPTRSILAEQFVSAGDGYSPDAIEKLNAVAQASNNVIQVNIHQDDSLAVPTTSTLISDYGKNFSEALINRTYFYDINTPVVDRFSYASRVAETNTIIVPVSVSIAGLTYDSTTRIINFTVQANFTGEVQGDYRFNAYLTENNVTGPIADQTFNGWNQLSFMYNTPWSPYYQTGTYLPSMDGYLLDASQYRHKWVLDAALDGSYGLPGIIPSTGGTSGQTFTRAYSYTLPVSSGGVFRYNADNIYAVAYVAEYSSDRNFRTILNSTQQKLTNKSEVISVHELSHDAGFVMYPNPNNGKFRFNFPDNTGKYFVEIKDVLGNSIKSFEYLNNQEIDLSYLSNGTYFVTVSHNGLHSVKKLIISH